MRKDRAHAPVYIGVVRRATVTARCGLAAQDIKSVLARRKGVKNLRPTALPGPAPSTLCPIRSQSLQLHCTSSMVYKHVQ